MDQDQRRKAIASAVAEASANAFVPTAIKVGLAAMAEELTELRRESAGRYDACCRVIEEQNRRLKKLEGRKNEAHA